MYKNKQHLNTWVIALLFSLWFLILPPILGLIFLVMQMSENKKLLQKYGEIDDLDKNISNLKNDFKTQREKLERKLNSDTEKFRDVQKMVQEDLNTLLTQKQQLETEISSLEYDSICKHFDFSDYSGLTSEECKNKLSLIKIEIQEAVKNQDFITITSTETKKVINSNIKVAKMLQCRVR